MAEQDAPGVRCSACGVAVTGGRRFCPGCGAPTAGRLPPDKALEIARQLAAGLAAAHVKGVLHRDLKPHNVMLDGRGVVRLTDFGLAGVADSFRGEEVRSGTPAYMSPKQLAGREVTVASEVYALGVVLHRERALFRGDDGANARARRPYREPRVHSETQGA